MDKKELERKEKNKIACKKWRDRNKQHISNYKKTYNETEAAREKRRAYSKKYYEQNKAKIKLNTKIYKRNLTGDKLEKLNKYRREYYAKNRGKIRSYQKNNASKYRKNTVRKKSLKMSKEEELALNKKDLDTIKYYIDNVWCVQPEAN